MPDDWEVVHALNPNAAGDARLDSDDDSIPNLLEYALALDPRRAGLVGLPRTALIRDGDERYMGFTFRRWIGFRNIGYIVGVSDDLKTWDSPSRQVTT